jgi:predicted CoA-binding protein
MVDRARLLEVLQESSDPKNPGLDEILDVLERSRRVAVIGMSRDPQKPARRIPSYLAANGYEIIPVNPHAARILGKPTRPTLAEVTELVDMVLLFRPSDQVGPFIRDAAARPERPVIWLQEHIRSDEEAEEARAQGITVIQDLCIFKIHRELDPEGKPRRGPHG